MIRILTTRCRAAARPSTISPIVASSVAVMSHVGIVRAHLAQVAVIADVVADAVLLDVGVHAERFAVTPLDQRERFEDRARVRLAAAEVVDLADAWAARRTHR